MSKFTSMGEFTRQTYVLWRFINSETRNEHLAYVTDTVKSFLLWYYNR